MRVIIAGDRHFSDYKLLLEALRTTAFEVTEVVSGGAAGADTLGELYAQEHGLPVRRFPADWERYGRAAGPIRNRAMAEYGEALIAFLAPHSRGTRSMIEQARQFGLPTEIINLR